MKIKLSNYIADFLVNYGITDMFTLTGGGAMHLNDSFGHKVGLNCIYNHHEQACSIAAEGYARITNKIAAICVTTGPGGTNAITGVLGGWLDSIPMLVISGQVKRENTISSTDLNLRQLGDQEYNIIDSVKPMTKYAVMVTEPKDIKYYLEKALYLAQNGRPGPVWLDIPLDVQAAIIDTENLREFDIIEEGLAKENPTYDKTKTTEILKKIKKSKRPVIVAGTGIRLADAHEEFLKVVEKLNIPVVTSYNAPDLIYEEEPRFCGRPGICGTRGGNFVIQNADLILSLGCRLGLRMIGFNYKAFAKEAYKIVVDIDENELKKPTLSVDMPIHANLKDVLDSILEEVKEQNICHKNWLKWARNINKRFPVVQEKYFEQNNPLNPYAFVEKLFQQLKENEKIAVANGTAYIASFQAGKMKKGQRMFANSGCASMGYGFPAAIGAAIATKGERIICLDGDGSFQMNLQELQTVVHNKLNLKIFIFNNNGYHSIRQTQTNLFNPPLVGVSSDNGISFPDLEKIAYAYGIDFIRIDSLENIDKKIKNTLNAENAIICEVIVDEKQNFEPKLSSKILPDGTMVSPELDDMFPFLSKEEYEEIKKSVLNL